MPGATSPTPVELRYDKAARVLHVTFDNDDCFTYTAEFLRVHSPSAEVRGHGPGQEVLQVGKERVEINAIDPVGRYAVRLCFDDGHDTGLYSWEELHWLGTHHDRLWNDYLNACGRPDTAADWIPEAWRGRWVARGTAVRLPHPPRW